MSCRTGLLVFSRFMTYICHSGENRNPEGFPQLPSVALGPSVRRDDGTYNKTCHEL